MTKLIEFDPISVTDLTNVDKEFVVGINTIEKSFESDTIKNQNRMDYMMLKSSLGLPLEKLLVVVTEDETTLSLYPFDIDYKLIKSDQIKLSDEKCWLEIKKNDEQILVVEDIELNKLFLEQQGIVPFTSLKGITITDAIRHKKQTKKRGDMEGNPTYRQLISYATLTRGDEVFVYERLSGSGEQRLVSSASIGVGGHMNLLGEGKENVQELFGRNFKKELTEELVLDEIIDNINISLHGYLNDKSDMVGCDHLAVLANVVVDEGTDIKVRETDVLQGKFVKIKDVKSIYGDKLENWSKIVLESYL